jgi:iron(III) transport system substrate-binding protein
MKTRKWIPILTILLVAILAGWWWRRSGPRPTTVVAYVSEDQVFSEPILRDFERETGIRVRAVFDTEEAKSTGVMNRLLGEKDNPQADVYWANEPIRAEMLKQRRIAAPYISPNATGIPEEFKDPEGFWTGFSARARVLIVHNRVTQKPDSIMAYTDRRWKGKGVIANPLFGTTTAHSAALFILWGNDKAKLFFEQIEGNNVRISTSNGESADLVAAGEADFALVDSDDAVSRARMGKPVSMVYPDQGEGGDGVFIVPNVVVMINGGPNPEAGRKLIDYLLSRDTERKLALADCAQIPFHSGIETPPDIPRIENLRVMKISYAEVAKRMQEIQPFLKDWVGY